MTDDNNQPPAETAPAHSGITFLVASLAAACAATLAIGIDLAQAARVGFSVYDTLAVTGFISLVAVPMLFALSLASRIVARGWRRTGPLAPTTAASWIVVGALAAGAFAWVTFRGTWLFALWTQFKPNVITLAQSALAIMTAFIIGIAAGPAARGLAYLLDRRDARRALGGAPPLRLRNALLVIGGLAVVVLAVVWRLVIVPRMYPALLQRDSWLGPTGRLVALLLALALLAGLPALWSRIAVRVGGVLAIVMTIATIVVAIYTVGSRSNAALTIWAEQPVAARVIERVFSLSAIRADLPASLAPVPRPNAEHRDVVVIVVEGLRADRTPPRGPTLAPSMPATRALAERSATAAAMYAASSSPSFALTALAVGTGADRLRGARTANGELTTLDPRHVTLAERLRQGGYATAAFACCPQQYGPGAARGLSRGFDRIEGATTGIELAKRAAAFLAAPRTAQPRFVWLHLADPVRWQSLDIANETPRDAYNVTLATTDRAITAFIGAISERPPGTAPYVIIIGAYAQATGERGHRGHGSDLSNPQIHVPFIATGPGIIHTDIAGPTSTLDLVPTVLDLAGFEPPRGARIDGQSLGPQLRTTTAPLSTSRVVTSALPLESPFTAIIEGNYKLFATATSSELYDLKTDPTERGSRTAERPDVTARLRTHLDARRATARLDPF